MSAGIRPMTRNDFRKMARIRLTEATVLLKARKYDGAYYLAGYAVECALKACIAKKTNRHDFPPEPRIVTNYYTHRFETLLGAADLLQRRDQDGRANRDLADNWVTAGKWNESRRYARNTKSEASELLEAISDEPNGVLAWIKPFW